jgi:hypothetical protein
MSGAAPACSRCAPRMTSRCSGIPRSELAPGRSSHLRAPCVAPAPSEAGVCTARTLGAEAPAVNVVTCKRGRPPSGPSPAVNTPMSLVPCASCRRHIKPGDCPFCARKQSSATAVLLLGVALGGCQPEARPPTAGAPSAPHAPNATGAPPATPTGVAPTAATSPAATPPASATGVATAPPAANPPQPAQPSRPMVARYGIAPSRN